jgi:hypothetical protein
MSSGSGGRFLMKWKGVIADEKASGIYDVVSSGTGSELFCTVSYCLLALRGTGSVGAKGFRTHCLKRTPTSLHHSC